MKALDLRDGQAFRLAATSTFHQARALLDVETQFVPLRFDAGARGIHAGGGGVVSHGRRHGISHEHGVFRLLSMPGQGVHSQ